MLALFKELPNKWLPFHNEIQGIFIENYIGEAEDYVKVLNEKSEYRYWIKEVPVITTIHGAFE